MLQLACKPPQAEQLDPSSSKFDRKGNSVELPADFAEQGRILVAQLEPVVACRCSRDEQLGSREPQRLGRGEALRCRRALQRSQVVDVLTFDTQWFATGCKNVHARRRLHNRDYQTRDGVDQM